MKSDDNKASARLGESSCDSTLTRAEFLQKVVKGAALTGGLLAAPRVLDKFLIPPAYAGASTTVTCVNSEANQGTNSSLGPNTDFVTSAGGEISCNGTPTFDASNHTSCSVDAPITNAAGIDSNC